MIARFIIFMLIAVLALPVATLTGSTEPSPSPWGEVAVAAKGKKHKKAKNKPPKPTTVTRTERQTVTQTFTSTEAITIPAGAGGAVTKGQADPYPSTIEVRGLRNGTMTDVNLILTDVTHTGLRDVDLLLSTSDGRQALVMSDVDYPTGGAVDIDLTLDDEATSSLPPAGQGDDLTSGTYRPTDHTEYVDTFAAPAPNPNGSIALSTFDGADPNGTWQLWVMDNATGDVGSIDGWALEITAEVDVQIEEPVPAKDKNKKGKHKKKGKQRR